MEFPAASHLSAENRALWQRLADFSFDAEGAAKPFSARLSTEHGWSAEHTARLLEEYRRFLFLTAVAGHVVCPSEEVDAAWHQHLIYSRSYWNDLCRDTLGRPLHHDPTSGGADESRKHWALYRQTLASYRRVFGVEPPRDIWPLAFDRFDPHAQPRVVDVSEYWMLRKPRWWPLRRSRPRGVAIALLPFAAIGLGPLDWSGPTFLTFFFGLFAVLVTVSLIYRHRQRELPVHDDWELQPTEAACLAFGRPAAVNATVAAMLSEQQLVSVPHRGLFGYKNGAKVKFEAGPNRPETSQPLATAVYDAVRNEPKSLSELQRAVVGETEAVEDRLQHAGYLLTDARSWPARLVPMLLMLSLFAVGFAKIVIGLSRDRPVEILIYGCVAAMIAAMLALIKPRRSHAGDRLLTALQSRHADLKTRVSATETVGQDIALCAALFGAAALPGTMYDDLKLAWRATAQGGAESAGACGGGCGGGGCGGGGCGGCGGD